MTEKRVLCVGMCVLDVIHDCREYPKEDTDKRCSNGYFQRGGNASNNCTVLNNLGVNCEFLGMISTDPSFQFLYDECKQKNINIENCPKTEKSPPFSSVILVHSTGTRTIIHCNNDFPILTFRDFQKLDLSQYSWIHFEARNLDETIQMISMIKTYNGRISDASKEDPIKISVEIEKIDKELFKLAVDVNVVFVGKDIADHLDCETPQMAVCLSRDIILNLKSNEFKNMPSIICPWGSMCTDCMDGNTGLISCVKAVRVDTVKDSLGAGDTLVAGVIYAMNHLKLATKEAVKYGNDLASFKIQHKGYDCVKNYNKK